MSIHLPFFFNIHEVFLSLNERWVVKDNNNLSTDYNQRGQITLLIPTNIRNDFSSKKIAMQ